jgi:MFS family permease
MASSTLEERATDERTTVTRIPGLIKRNTVLLALSQALTGTGMGVPYSIGPLVVVALTGSTALSGLAISLLGISRFVVAYPIGKIADTYGRKPALFLGMALGLTGTVLIGLAVLGHQFILFLVGMLLFGMCLSALHQLRVAAADMFPASRRGEALGYVLTGSVLGALLSPVMITAADTVSKPLGLDPLGLTWLFIPAVILPGVVCVAFIRPDPRDIALHLERYYPGYQRAPQGVAASAGRVSVGTFLRDHPLRVAIVSNFAAQSNMTIVMVIGSLVLAHHGHSLPAIAASSALHSIGMFAFSLPLGSLIDRFGRRAVMLPGGFVATTGALLAVFTSSYASITLGTFLVGLGWSAVNVATTVVITDRTRPTERGRAVGFNDSLAAVANTSTALTVGPLIALTGMPSAGVVAMAMMVVPFLLLLTLHEPRPGIYAHAWATEQKA